MDLAVEEAIEAAAVAAFGGRGGRGAAGRGDDGRPTSNFGGAGSAFEKRDRPGVLGVKMEADSMVPAE